MLPALLMLAIAWVLSLTVVVQCFRSQQAGQGLNSSSVRLEWSWHGFSLRFDGTRLERAVQRATRPILRQCRLLYSIGPSIALILMLITTFLLVSNIVRIIMLIGSRSAPATNADLPSTLVVPLVPGVTFPIDQAVYLWLAVAVSIVLHELGHAVCAVVMDVPLLHIGIASSLLIPIAFVELDSTALDTRRLVAKAVASAGVLHNLLVALAALLLSFAAPLLLAPLYSRSTNPIVTWVSPSSPLYSNVTSSTMILAVNNVAVNSAANFPPSELLVGVCLKASAIVAARDLNGDRCCESSAASPAGYCFAHINSGEPALFCVTSRATLPPFASRSCDDQQACGGDESCVRPHAPDDRVVDITTSVGRVIFIGRPNDLGSHMIELVDWEPRLAGVVPSRGPLMLARFLAFVTSVSLSLAFINAAPVEHMDGEHLLAAFAVTNTDVALVETILRAGSITLIANVVLAVGVIATR